MMPAGYLFVQRPQPSQVVKTRRALEQGRIVGRHRATFTGGNRLVDLQAVNIDIPHRTHRPALITGAVIHFAWQ